jgi:hypothetical protein
MSWEEYIKPFADAVGKTVEDVTAALKSEVGDPSDEAIEVLSNEEFTPFDSLKNCLSTLDIPSAILRKNIKLLRKKVEPADPMIIGSSLLPSIPDDSSFLEALKVGGELKVGITEIISAIKATLAKKVGLFEIPSKLAQKMESFAETCEEPVGKEFLEVRNMVIEKSYAEVMSVLGIKGSFVTESRKNTFLSKLESSLWIEVRSFYDQLSNWNYTWGETTNNPTILAHQIALMMGGDSGGVAPAMMQPPDTSVLKDAAEGLISVMNKIFSGFGIPIARALAYEAQRIKKILENDKLPSMIGAANREMMLRMLEADVASDYVRLERNMVQFIVAVMEYPKIAPNTEILYLSEMLKLGSAINFNKLNKDQAEVISKHKSF